MPFDEAVSVYQHLSVEQLEKESVKEGFSSIAEATYLPVPHHSSEMLEDDNLFVKSLLQITDQNHLQLLHLEFAILCNQIVSADQKTVTDRNGIKKIVKKASSYINIGLEKCVESKSNLLHATDYLIKYRLSSIFRVGYGCSLKLKWKAEKWQRDSWFKGKGLPISFWGEEGLGVLGGLLVKKPLYYDNYKDGNLYREFNSLEDIEQSEKKLGDIIDFDNLLSEIDIRLGSLVSFKFLNYKNLLLTLWANHFLKFEEHEEEPIPISMLHFKKLLSKLWVDDQTSSKISNSVKENFLQWLVFRTGLKDYEISENMGSLLEDLFKEIETEMGQVSANNIDPRYILLFLIRKEPT